MKDRVRQAKAYEILVLSARIRAWLRYWRSLAWWQGLSHRCSLDPVGEIFQPYRHRAEPVLFPVRRQGWQRTTSRGEIGKRVGLNPERTLALLFVTSGIEAMAGSGFVYVFERNNGRWTKKSEMQMWTT